MSYFIRNLSAADTRYIDEVCQLLATSYDLQISEFLIYRDKNYKEHLIRSLSSSSDFVHIALSADGDLLGFAQVRILENTLFLNNIIIKQQFRGASLASGLLRFMINEANIDGRGIDSFALDVFEKNAGALKWYQRLGMQMRSTRFWYDLTNAYAEVTVMHGSAEVSATKDEAGFVQVYSGDLRIGTLIAGNKLVMRAEIGSDVLQGLKRYFGNSLEGLCLITDSKLTYPLIDRSFQLQVRLNDLKLHDGSKEA